MRDFTTCMESLASWEIKSISSPGVVNNILNVDRFSRKALYYYYQLGMPTNLNSDERRSLVRFGQLCQEKKAQRSTKRYRY